MSSPVALPASPTRVGLHRTNAAYLRNQGDGSTSQSEQRSATGLPFVGGDRAARRSPSSPGKENRPYPSEDLQLEMRGRYGNLLQRSSSPDRSKKPRARSMSPNKAFRIRSRNNREAFEPLGGASTSDVPEAQRSTREVDHEFVSMLGTMQIPSAMMHKLMSLDTRVKDSMLKGQASLTLSALNNASNTSRSKIGLTERFTRSKSNSNLASSGSSTSNDVNLPFAKMSASRTPSGGSSDSSDGSSSSMQHGRDAIYRSRGNPSVVSLANSTTSTMRSRSGSVGGKENGSTSSMSATAYATMLKATDASRLQIAKIKKMRAVLSSESPAWLTEFFDESGYQAILIRLQELLEVEWRDEQHDDQLLHELLRCFVALSSTDCGRHALSSATPTPFVELSNLLFSEKRPGDLGTRKLLVEILCLLPDLPAPSLQAASRIEQVRSTRVRSTVLDYAIAQENRSTLLMLLLNILHNPRDPTQEALVDFISASHTPRPFKVLVTELLNINRDYFWVFCHSSNRFWALSNVDVNEAQGPKVPGGMTGGVEFEAMGYLTSHWRMINLVVGRVTDFATATGQFGLARDLHSLLFASGLDRALSITRKASQNYYQALHLEMARYFDLVRRAGFQMPAHLEAWQSSPQLLLAAGDSPSQAVAPQQAVTTPASAPSVPTKSFRAAPPQQAPPVFVLPSAPANLSVPLHNPHPITKPRPSTMAKAAVRSNDPSGDAMQGTLVGSAVRRWEQRAADSGIMGKFGAGQGSRSPPTLSGSAAPNAAVTSAGQMQWQAPKDWA